MAPSRQGAFDGGRRRLNLKRAEKSRQLAERLFGKPQPQHGDEPPDPSANERMNDLLREHAHKLHAPKSEEPPS